MDLTTLRKAGFNMAELKEVEEKKYFIYESNELKLLTKMFTLKNISIFNGEI